jgi:glycosyltransferase involved in cell wall biosynthesis
VPVGTVLVAHPSVDLYGSDLQLLESVHGLTAAGWRVVVTLPGTGPLADRLAAAGAELRVVDVPVLRKSMLNARGLLRLVLDCARILPLMLRTLRQVRPDAVYVNTVTIPFWLVVARLTGRHTLAHVHEAEDDVRGVVAFLLNAPLLFASTIVVNSRAARETLLRAVSALAKRTQVVHNGLPGPAEEPTPPPVGAEGPRRVVLVGRLSPRKGNDVALEALARLRTEGRDVRLELYGSVFPGYEWFEEQLRARSAEPDLSGAVHFAGYTSPTWPALARADVVLVPSRAEPFGNTAVEAQLAARPVVVSAVQGLREIVTDGVTGLLVPPGDAAALAGAIAGLLDDPQRAGELAAAGHRSAQENFSLDRYRTAITEAVARTAGH